MKTLLLLLASVAAVYGQGTNADCQLNFTLTSATSSATFDNRTRYCESWVMVYSSTGFTSSLALTLQQAPVDTGGIPGSWATYNGSVLSGTNPLTSVQNGTARFEGYRPFLRINLSGLTGTGTVQGRLYGWRYVASKVKESSGSSDIPQVPLVDTGFSWVNQGDSTLTVTSTSTTLYIPASGSANQRLRVRAAPSTPYTIVAGFRGAAILANYGQLSPIVLRESGTGEIITFSIGVTGGPAAFGVTVSRWNSPTSYNGNYAPHAWALLGTDNAFFFKLEDNGTNRIFSVSIDGGRVFYEVMSVASTDFLVADEIGFGANSENNTPMILELLHWKVS